MGVVDTIMVGRLGPAAIGAVALGNAVCYTPCMFGIGLLLGLDTLVAQAYGRKDHDECHRWLAQGVYLACDCGRADHGCGSCWQVLLCALRHRGGSCGTGGELSARAACGARCRC